MVLHLCVSILIQSDKVLNAERRHTKIIIHFAINLSKMRSESIIKKVILGSDILASRNANIHTYNICVVTPSSYFVSGCSLQSDVQLSEFEVRSASRGHSCSWNCGHIWYSTAYYVTCVSGIFEETDPVGHSDELLHINEGDQSHLSKSGFVKTKNNIRSKHIFHSIQSSVV